MQNFDLLIKQMRKFEHSLHANVVFSTLWKNYGLLRPPVFEMLTEMFAFVVTKKMKMSKLPAKQLSEFNSLFNFKLNYSSTNWLQKFYNYAES